MSSAPSFAGFGLPAHILRVLSEHGITTPTPIQAATLADALAGRDVLGRGRTGSGKTYAFLLPLVSRLSAGASPRRPQPGRPRALILAPTRELAGQIEAALAPLAAATGLRSLSVFGGVSDRPQIAALRSGVDVLVACPGRLEDLIRTGACSLAAVEITVLDEADHMADLGFLPSVTRLLSQTPERGQRLLFSATLDAAIDGLVRRFLHRPVRHEADSPAEPALLLSHHVLHVTTLDHFRVLSDLAAAPGKTVVFTRTKHRAKSIARQLNAAGVPATELHSNLSQGARTRSLESFQSGRVSTLVATDIAARGIHVDDVSLVVHADPPVDPKAYVHRSGRTARAGKAGTVVTMTTDAQLGDVRRLTHAAGISARTTRVDSTNHPLLAELAPGDRVLISQPTMVEAVRPVRGSRAGRGVGAARTSESLAPDAVAPVRKPAGRAPRMSGAGAAATAHSAEAFSRRSRRSRG